MRRTHVRSASDTTGPARAAGVPDVALAVPHGVQNAHDGISLATCPHKRKYTPQADGQGRQRGPFAPLTPPPPRPMTHTLHFRCASIFALDPQACAPCELMYSLISFLGSAASSAISLATISVHVCEGAMTVWELLTRGAARPMAPVCSPSSDSPGP